MAGPDQNPGKKLTKRQRAALAKEMAPLLKPPAIRKEAADRNKRRLLIAGVAGGGLLVLGAVAGIWENTSHRPPLSFADKIHQLEASVIRDPKSFKQIAAEAVSLTLEEYVKMFGVAAGGFTPEKSLLNTTDFVAAARAATGCDIAIAPIYQGITRNGIMYLHLDIHLYASSERRELRTAPLQRLIKTAAHEKGHQLVQPASNMDPRYKNGQNVGFNIYEDSPTLNLNGNSCRLLAQDEETIPSMNLDEATVEYRAGTFVQRSGIQNNPIASYMEQVNASRAHILPLFGNDDSTIFNLMIQSSRQGAYQAIGAKSRKPQDTGLSDAAIGKRLLKTNFDFKPY